MSGPVGPPRLDPLLDAVVSLATDAGLDDVLERVVAAAAHLTGARYAALGVVDETRASGLRSFVHRGMSDAEVAVVGDLPTGHGILGLLIERPEPLRLHDLAEHPSAQGFPAGHPPMHAFLGVPVRSRGRVFGNLYLTEKTGGGGFTAEDEEVVTALAVAAGVLVENARLHDEARRRERWLEATATIAVELVGSSDPGAQLALVADQARRAAGADAAWLVAGPADALGVEAVSGLPLSVEELRGVPLEHSLSAEVVRTGTAVTTRDYAADPRAQRFDDVAGWPEIGPAMVVPLRAGDEVVGALALGWSPEHDQDFRLLDPALASRFAEQAALALQVVRARAAEQRLMVLEDHDRIGRDLHDVVIQRLFATGLSLSALTGRVTDPGVVERLDAAVEELDTTVREIRRTIFALGATSGAGDLQSEVVRLVDRAETALKFRPHLEVSGPLRTGVREDVARHLVAVLGEVLANVARHADARRVEVVLDVGRQVSLTVVDDGRGVPPDVAESGLANVRERAVGLGGRCEVVSSPAGTTVTWVVPGTSGT